MAGLLPEILREWKILGPFPGTAPDAANLDDEPPFPLDPAALTSGDTQTLPWITASAQLNGVVDLTSILGAREWCSAYAVTEFDAPCDGPVTMAFTSDDAIRIWLNGEQVHSFEGSRSCSFNLPDRQIVRLRAGRNRILVKIVNYRAGWAFGVGFKCPIRQGST